jgi:hypothetical protein
MLATPGCNVVTAPLFDTVATDVFEDNHEKDFPLIAPPAAFRATAAS